MSRRIILACSAISGLAGLIIGGSDGYFLSPFPQAVEIEHGKISVVKSEGEIVAPGRYVLGGDISGSGDVVIRIEADGVDLDLDGRTISCRKNADSGVINYGVNADGAKKFSVRNGAIKDCAFGITAVDVAAFKVSQVDFSGVRHVGVNVRGTDVSIVSSQFRNISGYNREGYAIGVNFLCDGGTCRVHRNTFSELYRQKGAEKGMVGEGVGLIVRGGSSRIRVTRNIFVNSIVESGSIGVWVATRAEADLVENSFMGFERGIVSPGKVKARKNVLWLDKSTGDSRGIYGDGVAERNLIVGYATPLSGPEGKINEVDNAIYR